MATPSFSSTPATFAYPEQPWEFDRIAHNSYTTLLLAKDYSDDKFKEMKSFFEKYFKVYWYEKEGKIGTESHKQLGVRLLRSGAFDLETANGVNKSIIDYSKVICFPFPHAAVEVKDCEVKVPEDFAEVNKYLRELSKTDDIWKRVNGLFPTITQPDVFLYAQILAPSSLTETYILVQWKVMRLWEKGWVTNGTRKISSDWKKGCITCVSAAWIKSLENERLRVAELKMRVAELEKKWLLIRTGALPVITSSLIKPSPASHSPSTQRIKFVE